ncbi:WxL protein peptidoglycan domain-containing protein [Arthrobacter sp. 2MCAF14]|uniref:WxL protein peptidoglycan domain-containing protein n=1 Tax=Arthrobacter sp. 2MCAF14 TaxID=3232982 RepID=UPI003F90E7C7
MSVIDRHRRHPLKRSASRSHLLDAPVSILAAAFLAFAPSSGTDVGEQDPVITWAVSPANASEPDGRSWVERTMNPGEQTTEHLALRNLGDQNATFMLTAADGYFTTAGRFNMLPADRTSTDAGTWISVATKVSLAAHTTAIVPFTITVPKNATPGDHAAGIAASVLSTGTVQEGSRVGVESRVGFRVMTRVTGELKPELNVVDVEASYDMSWNPFAPGSATLKYGAVNRGNTRFAFTDSVDGAPARTRGDLLPGERRVSTSIVPVWPFGPVTIDLRVTPTADAAADAVPPPVRTSVVVWALPWSQLLCILGVTLIFTALALGRRRSKARLTKLIDAARAEGRAEGSSP